MVRQFKAEKSKRIVCCAARTRTAPHVAPPRAVSSSSRISSQTRQSKQTRRATDQSLSRPVFWTVVASHPFPSTRPPSQFSHHQVLRQQHTHRLGDPAFASSDFWTWSACFEYRYPSPPS